MMSMFQLYGLREKLKTSRFSFSNKRENDASIHRHGQARGGERGVSFLSAVAAW